LSLSEDTPGQSVSTPWPRESHIDQPSTDNDEYLELATAAGIAVNLLCIAVVLRRTGRLDHNGDAVRSWRSSRLVLAGFAVGLACAAVAPKPRLPPGLHSTR
jgi:hypothetical protein